MKKILISCLALLLASTAFVWSATAQSSPLPDNWETSVERAYRTWLGRIEPVQQLPRITTLKQRLVAANNKTDKQRIKELLRHIELLANESIVDLSRSTTRTTTTKVSNQPKTTAQQIVNRSPKPYFPNYQNIIRNYDEGTRVYQGWDKGALVSRYEFIAQREPFWIDEITITSNRSFDSIISKVTLFDENGVIIGSWSPSGRTITIRWINYLLAQWATDFYVLADFHPIGYGLTGWWVNSFNLDVSITDSRGYFSGDDRTVRSDRGDTVIVTPIKIVEYGFTRSFYGQIVDPYLNENAENTLWILTFTAGENDNRQATRPTDAEASIDQIILTVNSNLSGAERTQFLQSFTLDRLDRNIWTVINGTVQWDTVIFQPANASSSFARIEQWQQAWYRIRATLPKTSGRSSVKISVENLWNWWVLYSESESSDIISILDWGTYEISGPRLYEI